MGVERVAVGLELRLAGPRAPKSCRGRKWTAVGLNPPSDGYPSLGPLVPFSCDLETVTGENDASSCPHTADVLLSARNQTLFFQLDVSRNVVRTASQRVLWNITMIS